MVRHAPHEEKDVGVNDDDVRDGAADVARRLFAGPCSFVLAAHEPAHFGSLPEGLPEIAFWGKSNVGKSSLINGLTGRKTLARASNTPGRTRQIVFFSLGDRLLLADLPGYGYAKASKQEIVQWDGLIRHYLKNRAALRCVVLLIDSRHGITARDEERMAFLDTMAVSYRIVLTKADQSEEGALQELVGTCERTLATHPAALPSVFATSVKRPETMAGLRTVLAGYAEGSREGGV